jgi:PAP2 superfamily
VGLFDVSAPRYRSIRQALILAAIMFSSLGLYLLVLKWRGPDAAVVTHCPWDELIPYRPGWVWVYLIPYVAGPVLFTLVTPATFRWYIRRGLVVVLLSLAFFAVLPTRTAPRPPENSLGDSLTAQVYRSMVTIDEPPANAAPSLHVSLTCLLALALVRDFPRWWAVSFAGVAIVWLATLFTRQHHLIDVATGVLLAVGVVAVWPSSVRDRGIETIGDGQCRRK